MLIDTQPQDTEISEAYISLQARETDLKIAAAHVDDALNSR